MFSFKRKAPQPIIEDEADAVLVESPQDRIERAMRESCEADNEFSGRLIEAVKMIQKDRIMISGDTSCTYADALMALLGLVKRRNDDDIETLKAGLRSVVNQIAGEGEQFKTQEDAAKVLRDLRHS